MIVFYLFGIKCFYFLMAIASLFNSKAKLWLTGRKGIINKLKEEINTQEKLAWFHCASLGEFEQGRSLIESFKEKHKDYKILVTFFSPSGYEVRKNYDKADYVFYLPLDTPTNARQFLDAVNPSVVFFIKYEFWYFIIHEIGKRQIPLYLVSGIFRKNQRFFKNYAVQSRKMLKNFTHFFVQNKESQELLQSVNFDNVTISGDTRFDRVYTIAQQAKNLPLIEKFKADKITLVAGSTWKPDEEIIVKYFNENPQKFKLIIAPHEIHKENINRLISSFQKETGILKYSEANENNILTADVLIIDSIGLLSSLYKYGDIAYIGGGFGKGIHNTLEAATFGLPIIFGPNYLKFREAKDLISIDAANSIDSGIKLNKLLNTLLINNDEIVRKGNRSADYILKQKGATDKIITSIKV